MSDLKLLGRTLLEYKGFYYWRILFILMAVYILYPLKSIFFVLYLDFKCPSFSFTFYPSSVFISIIRYFFQLFPWWWLKASVFHDPWLGLLQRFIGIPISYSTGIVCNSTGTSYRIILFSDVSARLLVLHAVT